MKTDRLILIAGIIMNGLALAGLAAFYLAGHYIVTEPGKWYTPAEWSEISNLRWTVQSIGGILCLALPLSFIQWAMWVKAGEG